MLKIALQISELDLHDPLILRDQLIGVDSAYFSQVLNILNSKGTPEKIEFAYLIEIIDRIF